MYYGGRGGLGFSLKPPKSVRTAFANLFQTAVSATERAAGQAIDSRVPPRPAGFIESVPGGMGTLGLVGAGVGVLALVLLMGRRR